MDAEEDTAFKNYVMPDLKTEEELEWRPTFTYQTYFGTEIYQG